jgi:hypothetical protein
MTIPTIYGGAGVAQGSIRADGQSRSGRRAKTIASHSGYSRQWPWTNPISRQARLIARRGLSATLKIFPVIRGNDISRAVGNAGAEHGDVFQGQCGISRCRALYLETVFDYCRNEGVARIPSGQSFAHC